jgi:Hemerythrin HHE cation binding domain
VSESQSILEGLRSDHRAITETLADPGARTDTDAQREQLVMALVRHFVAEEQYLYPLLREHVGGGDALVEQNFRRDRACEQNLKQLESDDLTPQRLAEVWREVAASFSEHVSSQEATFPALEESVDAATLDELGADIRGSEQLAPTRPRSVSPESPAVNKVASLIEGFVDHVRDTYSHRGVDGG